MENVKKFYEALQADKALQERANQVNEQYKGTDPAAIDKKAGIGAIVEFAKGEGYDFTATELEAYQKGMRALPDQELDAVSGGVFQDTCYCIVGGGGTDDDTGSTCVCVVVGGGSKDRHRKSLGCVIGGYISEQTN